MGGKDSKPDDRKRGLELWERVKKTAKPLKATRAMPKPKPAESGSSPAKPVVSKNKSAGILRPAPSRPAHQPVTAPKPALLDDATAKKLAKGKLLIDGRIDLHGRTQFEAHVSLRDFLQDSYHSGSRVVLVITGKGRSGEGVLRQSVPRWLQEPAFREIVSGYREAHVTHGGGGAIYVRLRRKRP